MPTTPPQTLHSKTIFKNQWLQLKIDTLKPSLTKTQNYSYISRVNLGVSIIPYFPQSDSLLLVSQYRHPINNTIWQFPGGTKEKKQSLKQTAHRELTEETGYQAITLINLGKFSPDPGIIADSGQIFLALNPQKTTSADTKDPHEQVTHQIFPSNQVKSMIQKGVIRDGWTLASYLLFSFWKSEKNTKTSKTNPQLNY